MGVLLGALLALASQPKEAAAEEEEGEDGHGDADSQNEEAVAAIEKPKERIPVLSLMLLRANVCLMHDIGMDKSSFRPYFCSDVVQCPFSNSQTNSTAISNNISFWGPEMTEPNVIFHI